MTRRIYVILALLWGLFVGAVAHATVTPTMPASGKDLYDMHRGAHVTPRQVAFIHGCLRAEDSAAHLVLVDYNFSRTVYGCTRHGW